MAKKTKSKKKPNNVISPQEERARMEMRSLARASRLQRQVTSSSKALSRMVTTADGALLGVASILAARSGYELVQKDAAK